MNNILLDASALLCLINQEPGEDKVAAVLDEAIINTVNLAEVYSKLHEAGMPEEAKGNGALRCANAPYDWVSCCAEHCRRAVTSREKFPVSPCPRVPVSPCLPVNKSGHLFAGGSPSPFTIEQSLDDEFWPEK